MTNMATMPIYGKNLKKSSSPEPIDRWPWNLVCSIVYAGATKIIQSMTLGWPWPILRQCQIWSQAFVWEKVKIIIFWKLLQPKAQSWLKHSAKWVNEVEWVSKVKVILWLCSKITQISKLKLVFLRNSCVFWNQSACESLWENGNENLYKWFGSHDQHGRHAHIW